MKPHNHALFICSYSGFDETGFAYSNEGTNQDSCTMSEGILHNEWRFPRLEHTAPVLARLRQHPLLSHFLLLLSLLAFLLFSHYIPHSVLSPVLFKYFLLPNQSSNTFLQILTSSSYLVFAPPHVFLPSTPWLCSFFFEIPTDDIMWGAAIWWELPSLGKSLISRVVDGYNSKIPESRNFWQIT